MRIPSQMNDQNLYRDATERRRGKSGRQSKPVRTLIRMVLALILVLFVMHRASDSRIYETFFPDTTTEQSLKPATGNQLQFQTVSETNQPVSIETDSVELVSQATQIVDQLRPANQSVWIARLYRLSRPPAATNGEEVDEQALSGMLAATEILNRTQQTQWADAILSVRSSGKIMAEHAARLSVLRSALRDAAVRRCSDGATWRSNDLDGFYALICEANSVDGRGAGATGVTPLLQQPDVFRGTVVRINAMVARSELVDTAENAFGVNQYWRLWVVPNDGSRRLIEFITADVTPAIAALDPTGTEKKGPKVSLVGRYLKRRSYAGTAQAELAPVVIGRILNRTVLVQPNDIDQAQPADGRTPSMALAIGGATVLGIALAALAMWRARSMEQRVRHIRQSNRAEPTVFLSQLSTDDADGDTPDSTPNSNADSLEA